MLKELPADERPREKMWAKGPEALSNAELLAILIRTGVPGQSALRLAEKLLLAWDGLGGLAAVTMAELARFNGMGPAKAATVAAALELAKRLAAEKGAPRRVIRTPRDVADLLLPQMRYLRREHFVILLLNTKNRVLACSTVSIGSLNASIVHPRELFREAISRSAAHIVLVHNHPSGDPTPSPEDVALTRRLVEGGRLLDVGVLDHVIIGDGRYVSLKEQGII